MRSSPSVSLWSKQKTLSEVGREAKLAPAQMLNSGVSLDSVTSPLAKARKAKWANVVEEVDTKEVKQKRSC